MTQTKMTNGNDQTITQPLCGYGWPHCCPRDYDDCDYGGGGFVLFHL